MKCIEYAKEYIRQKGFKIIREDEHYISFYYQMNCIYLFDNEEQDDFMVVSLPDFTDITQDNIDQARLIIEQVNCISKQVKLFIRKDTLWATAEIYFCSQNDFNFQFKKALHNLIEAKSIYERLEN